jgi:hypothetical protein
LQFHRRGFPIAQVVSENNDKKEVSKAMDIYGRMDFELAAAHHDALHRHLTGQP